MRHGRLNLLEIVAFAALIGLGAWLIVHDSPTRAETTIGGFLFGAAVSSGLDLLGRVRAAADAEEARRRQDRDETRRLIYAAHMEHDLAGTVMNAVMHHWRAYTFPDALALAHKVKSGHLDAGDLVELTTLLTDEIGDHPPDATKHLDLGPAPIRQPAQE